MGNTVNFRSKSREGMEIYNSINRWFDRIRSNKLRISKQILLLRLEDGLLLVGNFYGLLIDQVSLEV